MNFREFAQDRRSQLPIGWSIQQKADELALWGIEAGYGNVPELSIDGEPGLAQHDYDMAVEEAFSFLRGEARAVLMS